MQTVLITGASSGIGYEFAHIFAQNNYNLVLVARNKEKLEEIQKTYPNITVQVIIKDLRENIAPKSLFEALQKTPIDILVNNAGFWDYGYFHEIDIEKELSMIDLNVRSLTELTYLFWKEMVKRKNGKILNVASTAAFFPGPLMSVYYATKHYVLAFSEGIAEEWAPYGVSVTTLCPGPTESWFQNSAQMGNSKLFKWKKLPTSKEVAEFGYTSMMKGKRVAIHGFLNNILVSSTRMIPSTISSKIVKKVQEKG